MRLESLKLVRYGHFTQRSIDFGRSPAPGANELDFHLVYGPNEAGKSTLRSAAIDFMFGFPTRTDYNFMHANEALQVGGVIRTGDELHELTRIKRSKNSLLGVDGQPVAMDVFRGVLGEIGRDGYANMFSLDEDLLEKGGESILRSEGDLGELLFSSASGLSALSGGLGDVRDETEKFYKSGARKFVLTEMKEELARLNREIRENDVLASHYAKLTKAQSAAHKKYLAVCEARDQKSGELKQLQALLDCARPWFDYRQVKFRLAELGELPQLPDGWLAEAETLAQSTAASARSMEDAKRNAQRAQDALNAIVLGPELLALGGRIDRLAADDLEAKFKAAGEIERCERTLLELTDSARQLCARLPVAQDVDPAELVLPVTLQARIKALMEPHAKLEERLVATKEEVQRAQRELAAVHERHTGRESTPDLNAVAEVLELVRQDGDDRDLQQLNRMLAEQEAALASAMVALAPWAGSVDDLRAVPLATAARLDELKQNKARLAQDAAALAAENERLAEERSKNQLSRAQLEDREELITDETVHKVRVLREAAWREHRAGLVGEKLDKDGLNKSADKVEAALAEDERIAATRLSQAAQAANLRQLNAAVLGIDERTERHAERASELAGAELDLAKQTDALCASLGLPTNTPIAGIETWLNRREQILNDADKLVELKAQHALIAQRIEGALARLATVMTEHEIRAAPDDWLLCVQRTEAALAAWQEQRQQGAELATALQSAERELAARTEATDQAAQEVAIWQTEWAEALAGQWVEGLSAVEMADVLQVVTELAAVLERAREVRGRIDGMTTDRAHYVAEVTELADLADCPFDASQPLATADKLRELLGSARDNQRRFDEKTAELKQINLDLEAAEAANIQADTRFRLMTELFPASDFGTLLAAMRKSGERQQATAALKSLQNQLTERLLVPSFEDVEALLHERLGSPEAHEKIEQEHIAAELERTEIEENVAACYHEWRDTVRQLELIGDDADVALLQEQARVLLLDIEAQARRYMSLAAGTLVVEQALTTYLNTHRSTMLESASSAFAAVTRGAFTGLAAVPRGNREELLGVREDGRSLLATDMSRGTRFQLYLSLRIAGYHEFVRHREPLPFFADDILETFDDDRSAETFALMAQMARSGQVIYLTHHKHLCELAKEVTKGQVRIHELAGQV